MVSLLVLMACLERVTDAPVPLDPRFTEGGGDAGAASEVVLGEPWADAEGPTVAVRFAISGHRGAAVVVDILTPDPLQPGGVKREGRVEAADGQLKLAVPARVKAFTVEAFVDLTTDGPSADDPYATVAVDMTSLPQGELALALVPGGRPAPGAAGAGGVPPPWANFAGPTLPAAIELEAGTADSVQLDFTVPDDTAPGGQARVGQVRTDGSARVQLDVPTNVPRFRIEAFADLAADGPTDEDPYAEALVEMASLSGPVKLVLAVGGRGVPGSPGGVPQPGAAAPTPSPWSGETGPTWPFVAQVEAPGPGEVQVDVTVADAAAPGGQRRVGQVRLGGTGEVRLAVPQSVTTFRLEAFQDPGRDGPSDQDPYAELTIDGVQSAPVTLRLAVGARGKPSAAPQPPAGGSPTASAPVPTTPMVRLSGTVRGGGPGAAKVDIFLVDPAAKGGRRFLRKVEVNAGVWSVDLAEGLGSVMVEAYVDRAGDGPSGDDPHAALPAPVMVGKAAVSGLNLVLPD